MFQPEGLPELITPDAESGVLVADDGLLATGTLVMDAVEEADDSQEAWLKPDGALGLSADGRRRSEEEDDDFDAADDDEDEDVDDEDDFYDDDFDEDEEEDDDFDAFVDDDDE